MNNISTRYSESVRSLLNGLIDYAGLFPPAKLDISSALANFFRYRKEEYAWVLSRFILPVSRLCEFEQVAAKAVSEENPSPFLLSVISGDDILKDVKKISVFNNSMFAAGNNYLIDTIEVKVLTIAEILKIHDLLPSHLQVYFEITPNRHMEEMIEAVSLVGSRAKVRTGGIASNLFPSSADLLQFIESCSRLDVPFKATAGLHHPIRAEYKFTYDPESPRGKMYGFLNVFLTAGFIRSGMSMADASGVLEEESKNAFLFDDAGIEWRGFRLDLDHIKSLRESLAISFGSCSFTEPINELRSLGLL